MPSTRTSILIGLWVLLALLLIADFTGFIVLDIYYTGLSSLVNVLVLTFFIIWIASAIIDFRAKPSEEEAPQEIPHGIRSASGEQITPTRPQPRVRRGRRAAKLETIVVEPGPSLHTPPTRARRARTVDSTADIEAQSAEERERDMKMQEQLEAIEHEMAKLEGELKDTGPTTQPEPEVTDIPPEEEEQEAPKEEPDAVPEPRELTEEEAASELLATAELIARLEEKRRAGLVDDSTYERLRTKYLKRKDELAQKD